MRYAMFSKEGPQTNILATIVEIQGHDLGLEPVFNKGFEGNEGLSYLGFLF